MITAISGFNQNGLKINLAEKGVNENYLNPSNQLPDTFVNSKQANSIAFTASIGTIISRAGEEISIATTRIFNDLLGKGFSVVKDPIVVNDNYPGPPVLDLIGNTISDPIDGGIIHEMHEVPPLEIPDIGEAIGNLGEGIADLGEHAIDAAATVGEKVIEFAQDFIQGAIDLLS
ncbi:MAG: hypothetical protein PHC64_00470 [Candidatus Gastranaerophilales bacterium]|nr:hypothetical protein [Candidatus Gastranaerophilales bacterium]